MKNFNLILVLVGILLFSVLIVENIAIPMQVLVFISYKEVYWLVFFSTVIGVMLGWGFYGMINGKKSGGYDDGDDGEGF